MGWSFGYAGFVPQETRITTEDWYDVPVMGWRQVAVPPEDPAKLQPPRGNRTYMENQNFEQLEAERHCTSARLGLPAVRHIA